MRIDRYETVRELGRGGMGTVYEAVTDEGARVALKVFTLDHGNVELLERRFQAEARILQELGRVRDYGLSEGRPWFAMDLVLNAAGESETLEAARKKGDVPDGVLRRWFSELVDALKELHARGIVHRDVKLENVLVDAEGHAILTDFGVSRILNDDLRAKFDLSTTFVTGETTGSRPVMGSYWYLAPEVREGGEATEASDWYALGVLFFRLLTGMWYEPGSRAFDLLEPFPSFWREMLPKLLGTVEERQTAVQMCVERPQRRHGRKVALVALSVLVLGIMSGVGWFGWRVGRPQMAETIVMRDCGGYALSETPVTRMQWVQVMGGDSPSEETANWPITNITWDEATNFCARLTAARRAAKPYRLPTAKEWCDAFRKGKTVDRIEWKQSVSSPLRKQACEVGWFGQDELGRVKNANVVEWYRARKKSCPTLKDIDPTFPPEAIGGNKDAWMRRSAHVPMPVALKPANELGLYDMAGNVFEMVQDRTSANVPHSYSSTEYGFQYQGMPPAGTETPVLFGQPFTPGINCDEPWGTHFPKMPHMGFRLAQ